MLLGDGTPDGVSDCRDGVGAESRPSGAVVALQSTPETKTPFVQSIGKGQLAKPLLSDDPADQPLVLGQLFAGDDSPTNLDDCGKLRQDDTSCVGSSRPLT